MKTFLQRILAGLTVIFAIWILALAFLGLKIEYATHLLKGTKPIVEPQVAMTAADPAERKTVTHLFDSQMRALFALRASKHPALIPLLIPYLDYSTYQNPPYLDVPRPFGAVPPPPDLDTLCDRFPALAAIVGTPGAAAVLADYAMNPENRLNLRVASYQVLGYLDKDKFDVVSRRFDTEFAGSNRDIKGFLDAVEKGDAPFKGIYPLEASQ